MPLTTLPEYIIFVSVSEQFQPNKLCPGLAPHYRTAVFPAESCYYEKNKEFGSTLSDKGGIEINCIRLHP